MVRKSLFAFFYVLDAPCAPTKGDANGESSMSMVRGTKRKERTARRRSIESSFAPPDLFTQDQNGSRPNSKKVLVRS